MTVPNNSNFYLPGTIQIPSTLVITGITQALPMVITFTVPVATASNSYIPGQLIRLTVPQSYGMYQANGLTGKIVAVTISTISLNIDSRGFDAFVMPSGNAEQPATFAPSGSQNLAYDNSTDLLPFQSLNDIGN